MNNDIYHLLQPILDEAGRIMRSAHNHDVSSSVLVKPGDANFVTAYDFQVQEFLIAKITEAIPDAVFIAEEQTNDPAVLAGAHCFIIDPIDGTTNFIHNYRHSCISVAMLSFGEVVFGAVYDPYLDELFCAAKGEGAYLNGHPIHVSDCTMDRALVSFGTCPYYKDTLAEPSFRLCKELFLRCSDVRRAGSAALDLAYVAAGRCDIFFEFLLSPWDIAAGYLLIAEAGGIITDMNGAPIHFDAPSPVLAATPTIHPDLLALVKSL
jgi:myo-inositol-1(or 4)-monophosphatase